MDKRFLPEVSAVVPATAQLSPTGQDRTGQERTSSRGEWKLGEYLQAPEHIQRQFDRRILEAVAAQRSAEDFEEECGWDFLWIPPRPEAGVGVSWDGSWSRKVERAKRNQDSGRQLYDRDNDPLLDVHLPDVWEDLTGYSLRGNVSSCPSPDHPDRFPSCVVRSRLWFCNGCDASGSIIDLGALIYDIEPRGRGFFEIRNGLLASLGVEERAA